MRILAIDAGNSRLKWGLWEDEWSCQGAVPITQIGALAAAWQVLPAPDRIVACTVAGITVSQWLEQWSQNRGHLLRWVTSAPEQCGVRNGYQDPSQLGADRWVGLIAARHLVPGAALVVNAGTAVTIDALMADGEFHGGLIVPGLDLMASSLASGTAGLASTPGVFQAFPNNTAGAIASGAIQAVCGAIERMERAMSAGGASPQILLSGGTAAAIQARFGRAVLVVPNLVLEGLRIIALEESGA